MLQAARLARVERASKDRPDVDDHRTPAAHAIGALWRFDLGDTRRAEIIDTVDHLLTQRHWTFDSLLVGGGLAGAMFATSVASVPLCPLHEATGLDCPLCGGTRAVASLLHGDILGAIDHNVLAVLVILPLLAWFAVRATRTLWRGEPVVWPTTRWWFIALLVAFTVVRNLPFAWAHPLRAGLT
jgi:hypothetical protein